MPQKAEYTCCSSVAFERSNENTFTLQRECRRNKMYACPAAGVTIEDSEAAAVSIILSRLTRLERLVLSTRCRCCQRTTDGKKCTTMLCVPTGAISRQALHRVSAMSLVSGTGLGPLGATTLAAHIDTCSYLSTLDIACE
jgi:hypothetical protein